MTAMHQAAFAREAGTSRQAVNDGLRRGLLRAGPDGLLDASVEPNRSWLAMHVKHGADFRGRDMASYPTGPKAPKSADDGNGLDIHDEAALDAWMKKTLAEFERTRMTDEELDALASELINRTELGMSPIDQQFLHRLDELTREVAALRQQQQRCTYETTLRDVVKALGDIEFRFGVFFHQMCRLIRGEGLTVVDEAFGPVDPALREPAPVKRRT